MLVLVTTFCSYCMNPCYCRPIGRISKKGVRYGNCRRYSEERRKAPISPRKARKVFLHFHRLHCTTAASGLLAIRTVTVSLTTWKGNVSLACKMVPSRESLIPRCRFRTVHAQAAALESLLCSDDGDFSMASRQLTMSV